MKWALCITDAQGYHELGISTEQRDALLEQGLIEACPWGHGLCPVYYNTTNGTYARIRSLLRHT